MKRTVFLTIASCTATGVGFFSLLFPAALQQSKGTAANAATYVWTAEVGILLIAIGIMAFLVRRQETSLSLLAFFIGNFIIQAGLFVIEFAAYFNGVITKLTGIVPNLTIHIFWAFGFAYYIREMKTHN